MRKGNSALEMFPIPLPKGLTYPNAKTWHPEERPPPTCWCCDVKEPFLSAGPVYDPASFLRCQSNKKTFCFAKHFGV